MTTRSIKMICEDCDGDGCVSCAFSGYYTVDIEEEEVEVVRQERAQWFGTDYRERFGDDYGISDSSPDEPSFPEG